MNAELKKLYDQKGNTWAQMQDVARKLKEGKELSTEENTQFDKWDGELKSITDKIAKIERAEKLEAEMAASKLEPQAGSGEKQNAVNLGSFSSKERRNIWNTAERRGVESLSKEEKDAYQAMQKENKAFSKFMIGLDLNEEERKIVKGLEVRAQSTSNSAGGYTIPQGFIARVDRKLKMISPFFAEDLVGSTSEAENVFEFIRTDTGNTLPIPTNDDTSTTGELLAENTDAFANTADLTFAQVSFLAYKYNSKPMKVSNELLNDSGIDLENLVADVLATRIGRIVNTHFTTGTNSSQPQGIVTGATAGKTTAGATAITFPEIIDLVHSVDAAYRKSPSARFMLHDLILAYLKKQTIGSSTNDSRPLWQPGYTQGAPDTIDGYRYLVNNDMASTVATTNITMLFGDMKKYGIRQVNGYTVKRLNERFADYDQTAWLMFARFDGRYLNTSAIKKMTQA
jgi:HK97 family phage major capsid protein